MERSGIFLYFFVFPALVLFSCRTRAPEHPEPDQLEWMTYMHPSLDYRLIYPAIYTIHHDGENIFFRYQGHPSFVIRYCSREEAERKGLWAANESEAKVRFAGHEWEAYDYDHRDAFFLMRTISFVSPYRDAYLSIDVRTDGDLNDVHQKMIYSFTFL